MNILSLFLNRGSNKVILFILLSFSHSVYAAEWCIIKDKMSPELSAYIATTEALLSRIKTEAGKTQCNKNSNGGNSASASIKQATSKIIGSSNSVFGFSNFLTSVEFFSLNLIGSPPPAIMRDNKQLSRELENIKNTVDFVYNQCAGNSIFPESIRKENLLYNAPGSTLGDVLSSMLKNQINIMNIYRGTVTGTNFFKPDLYLVGDKAVFYTNLGNAYGKTTWFGGGSPCESNFGLSVTAALNRIKDGWGGIDKWMTEWTNALKLLNGDKYEETEQNLLRNELSKQWLSTKSSQAIMNNLKKYNATNASEGVTGFVKSIGERVVSSFENLTANIDGMTTYLSQIYNSSKKSISTDKYIQKKIELNTNLAITQEIIQDYETAKIMIWLENQNTDEIVWKLMDTHINLESTNKYLQPFIKVSQKVCNAQSTGNGNCQ